MIFPTKATNSPPSDSLYLMESKSFHRKSQLPWYRREGRSKKSHTSSVFKDGETFDYHDWDMREGDDVTPVKHWEQYRRKTGSIWDMGEAMLEEKLRTVFPPLSELRTLS